MKRYDSFVNLAELLRTTKEDEIIVRAPFVKGCWYDVEIIAFKAGFDIVRFNDPYYAKKHENDSCYHLYRKKV